MITKSIIILTIIALFCFCKSDETETKIEENVNITLQKVRTFGNPENNDDNFKLNSPRDVVVDSYNDIYILDTRNDRIQKYDMDGKFLKSIRKFPESFFTPMSLDIDSRNNLYVVENLQERLDIFNSYGNLSRTINLGDKTNYLLALSAGRFVIGRLTMNDVAGHSSHSLDPLIWIFDNNGVLINEFAEPDDYNDKELNDTKNSFYMAVDKDDNIYISFGFKNRIEKYSIDGKKLLSFKRNEPPQFDPDREIIPVLNRYWSISESSYFSKGIGIDGKSRIWILARREPAKMLDENHDDNSNDENSLQFEVYNEKGKLLTKVPVNHWLFYFRIFGDKLFLIDALIRDMVYQYTIIDN